MDRKRFAPATTIAAMLMISGLLAGCGGNDAGENEMASETQAPAAAPAAPTMPPATEVQAEQLQTGAAAMKGQTVRVNAVTVASTLGSKAFWFSLPNKNPFLVMTDDSVTVKPQDQVDVVGTVQVMNDSILNAWVQSGAINDNQKLEAEFATEFIQAMAVQPTGGAAGGMGGMADSTKNAPAK